MVGDLNAVLTAWIECLEPLPWAVLQEPTPSRGRSLRELSVNVFRPIELLVEAWRDGRFFWIANEDDVRVERLNDPGLLLDYIRGVQQAWTVFMGEEADNLGGAERPVLTAKGDLTYRSLLDAQRLHAAYHLRQLIEFLESSGRAPAVRFRPEHIQGLQLPAAVF
jgi:hypothetical protein